MDIQAAPIRTDPLDFGEKLVVRKQKPSAVSQLEEPQAAATEEELDSIQAAVATGETQSDRIAGQEKAEPDASNEGPVQHGGDASHAESTVHAPTAPGEESVG